MKFIAQVNFIREDQLQKLRGAVERYPHEYVSVLPFSHEIVSDQPLEGTDFIPYGSTTMIKVAESLGWKGLYWDPSRFNYAAYIANRDDMLNDGVMTVAEAVEVLRRSDDRDWFIRPCEDLKYFSGGVQQAQRCLNWLEGSMAVASSTSGVIDPDMLVVLSGLKDIITEWRWFIVDGKIISGSTYRIDGRTKLYDVRDRGEIAVAQEIADQWLPHPTCVMDTALIDRHSLVSSESPFKVVEFNCLNGSGFYDHDVPKIFDALWGYANG